MLLTATDTVKFVVRIDKFLQNSFMFTDEEGKRKNLSEIEYALLMTGPIMNDIFNNLLDILELRWGEILSNGLDGQIIGIDLLDNGLYFGLEGLTFSFPAQLSNIKCLRGALKNLYFYKESIIQKAKLLPDPKKQNHAYNKIFHADSDTLLASVYDAQVYSNSDFYLNRTEYIQNEDYVLGDLAYPISLFLISPFKNPFNHRQCQFNFIHSKHRVVVKHAFGRLKARFRVLKRNLC
ncbi:17070_t:CDS:2 [Funneliformis geosporum]|nr:17070_t:CDS:2 [Funneliformis geosporum]